MVGVTRIGRVLNGSEPFVQPLHQTPIFKEHLTNKKAPLSFTLVGLCFRLVFTTEPSAKAPKGFGYSDYSVVD
jgi:hypothetical protein